MKINNLPVEIQNRIFTVQIEQGNKANADLDLLLKKAQGNFDWHQTDEDYPFWANVYRGEFTEFWGKYGHSYPDPALKFQNDLKQVINNIIRDCAFTMSEHNWEALSETISTHLQKMLAK